MRRATAALALLTALAACDDGAPPARGFGSRQLLTVRDTDFGFMGTWENLVLYATGAGFWSIDADSGQIRQHDKDYSDLVMPGGGGSTTNARYACNWSPLGGVRHVVVTDRQTMQQTTIGGIIGPLSPCPTEADPTLSLWRQDDAGRLALWAGPFDALQPTALDPGIVVRELVWLAGGTTYLLGSAPDELDAAALALYRVDHRTFTATLLIPAALADAAWAAGTTPGGPLASTALTYTNGAHWLTLGGRFVYERAMSDGSVAVFTGPFEPPGPRELALFHVDPALHLASAYVDVQGGTVVNASRLIAWRQFDDLGMNRRLHVWHEERRQLVSCPLSGRYEIAIEATADRRRVLAFAKPGDYDRGIPESRGPVVLATPETAGVDGSGGCVELAPDHAVSAGFSPDGAALFWLLRPTPGDSDAELWAAVSDGSGARLLGRGEIWWAQFVGPSQLEIALGQDIAWVDVYEDPVHMNYIADDVFGNAIAVGRWLVIGYKRNHQDGNGLLGVVNRDTGEPRLISPEVALYMPVPIPRGHPLSSTALLAPQRVAYLVRGRNPSSQDGIWIATIDPAELR
jgi:hypothetical protein